MAIAYHLTFSTYGHILPNQPDGSTSQYVRRGRLWFLHGHAYPNRPDREAPDLEQWRLLADSDLRSSPVILGSRQIESVGRGIANACAESGYVIHALAVMSNHVHAVIDHHERPPSRIVGHLKTRASQQLERDGIHPFDREPDGTLPTMWGRKCWTIFLDTDSDIAGAAEYVTGNPTAIGLPAQNWPFVQTDPTNAGRKRSH